MNKKHLDIETKKKFAIMAIKWCRENLGVNDRKRKKLVLEFSDKKRVKGKFIIYANYCFWRNRIMIYEPNCETVYDVVSTIIHEYTHYLQSRTKYKTYEKTHFYSTNPLEREAKRNEEKYTKHCIKDIKNGYIKCCRL